MENRKIRLIKTDKTVIKRYGSDQDYFDAMELPEFISPRDDNSSDHNENSTASMHAEDFRKIIKEEIGHKDQIEININSKNEIYLVNNPNRLFELSSNYVNLFDHLMIVNTYIDSKTLLRLSSYKNLSSLRKAIGELNKKISYRLDIDEHIIDGKRGSGYRISPVYKLRKVK